MKTLWVDDSSLLDDSPARLEPARSPVELGAALRRRGNRVEAGEPLTMGRELAHLCGADRTLARGRPNAEAPQDLLVSLKTVETHRSRGYAKLGLSGGARRRLHEALHRDAPAG